MTTPYCDDSILESDTGPVNIEINWEPNEINLRWYNNNTLMTVDNTSNSCLYDDNLTMPQTAPTRTGYTFKGWRVRPQYDFSTLPTNQNGTERWAKSWASTGDTCQHAFTGTASSVSCNSYDDYKELNRYEWKVKFSWGYVYGSSYCSAKSGSTDSERWLTDSVSYWLATYEQLKNVNGDKTYCWCQATGYKPNGANTLYGPMSASSTSEWRFYYSHGSATHCYIHCAAHCALGVLSKSAFRSAMFGVTQ